MIIQFKIVIRLIILLFNTILPKPIHDSRLIDYFDILKQLTVYNHQSSSLDIEIF